MNLIFILYDSIENSVFAGQIWQAALKLLTQNKYQKILVISFEIKLITHNYIHPDIEIVQIKRTKYFGKISLFFNLLNLTKYLPKTNYHLIARGPLAGFLANQLIKNLNCQKITIQVRGLLAEEYLYNQTQIDIFKRIFIKIRYRQLFKLEQAVYKQAHKKLTIECVSPALKKYLIKTFKLKKQNFSLAQNDLPAKIKPGLLNLWRYNLRKQLNICQNTTVYCYAGSNHKWQCCEETVIFFKSKLQQDQNAFLLILTKQINWFENLIQEKQIPRSNYCVISIEHAQIYQYLALADYGLIFRQNHIINWISRPTKALEYDCVGLKIIHNNTINWLANKKKTARI